MTLFACQPDDPDDLFAPLTPEEQALFPDDLPIPPQAYFDAFIAELQRQLDAIQNVEDDELP